MTELNRRLTRAAGDVTASLDLDDLHRRADRHRRRQRAARGVSIVAVALVVIAAAVLAVSTRSSTTDVAHPNRDPAGVGEPGRWVPIAKAPIRPTRFSFALSTGSEVVVFTTTDTVCDAVDPTSCGPSNDPDQVLATGGAAYDASTDTWRRISPPPIGFARSQAQVIDGRIYALGRTNRTDTAIQLIRYDPRSDTWTRLASSDTPSFGIWEKSTTYGDQLVVYDPAPHVGTVADAAFDTSTETWRELPTDPIFSDGNVRSGSRQLVEWGSRLYRFAGVQVIPTPGSIQPEYTVHPVERIAVLDDGKWRPLDVASTASESMGAGTWAETGDHLTMVDPAALNPYSKGAQVNGAASLTFDPKTRRLSDVPNPLPPPGELFGAFDIVSNGSAMAVLYPTWGAVLDPATESWETIEVPGKQRLSGFASSFTGDQLLFWGGHVDPMGSGSTVRSTDGWIWTPSTSNSSSATASSSTTRPSTTVPAGTSISQLAAGSWRDVPMPPVPMGGDAGVVWTGTRLFAWGGTSDPTKFQVQGISRRAALYDPTSRKWRRTSEAPIVSRSNPTTVWTGSEVLIWGGLDASRHVVDDGAAYDPATDTWRILPRADAPGTGTRTPGVRPTMQTAVWTGTELAVFTPIDPTSTDATTIGQAFYDPTTDAWRGRGPEHQARAGNRLAGIDAVVVNRKVLVWLSWSSTMRQRSDGSSTEDVAGRQLLFEVDTDPDEDAVGWTEVPLDAAAPVITDPIVAGDVVAATSNPHWLSPEYRGPASSSIPTSVLSLTKGRTGPVATWTAMPRGRLETTDQPQVWTGYAIIRFNVEGRPSPTSSQRPGDLAALDLTSRVWTDLPRSPWDADSGTLRLVWAGDRLIVWGDLSTTCTSSARGCTPWQGAHILGAELDPG